MRPKRTGALAILFFPIALTFLLASAIASQPAQAQTFKVLHRFHGAPNDGAFPWTQLDRDTNGNLYGTTEQGGNGNGVCVSHFNGCGTVFRLSKSGKPTLLHSFNDTDGADPVAGVLRDKEGNLLRHHCCWAATQAVTSMAVARCSSWTKRERKPSCTHFAGHRMDGFPRPFSSRTGREICTAPLIWAAVMGTGRHSGWIRAA
jgi:hypothetical protein